MPRAADPAAIERRARTLADACENAGVAFAACRVRSVHEPEFNAGVAQFGNKASALFQWGAPFVDAVAYSRALPEIKEMVEASIGSETQVEFTGIGAVPGAERPLDQHVLADHQAIGTDQ